MPPRFTGFADARLEDIFQSKLNQARRHGSLRDHPEVSGSKDRPWVRELGVVKRIVEFDAELQLGVFAEAAHPSRLPQRHIPIELPRPVNDALPGISITSGTIRANNRRRADYACRIKPMGQTIFISPESRQIRVGHSGAEGNRGGSCASIYRPAVAIRQCQRTATLDRRNARHRPTS